jgi:hypothetical protein
MLSSLLFLLVLVIFWTLRSNRKIAPKELVTSHSMLQAGSISGQET